MTTAPWPETGLGPPSLESWDLRLTETCPPHQHSSALISNIIHKAKRTVILSSTSLTLASKLGRRKQRRMGLRDEGLKQCELRSNKTWDAITSATSYRFGSCYIPWAALRQRHHNWEAMWSICFHFLSLLTRCHVDASVDTESYQILYKDQRHRDTDPLFP